jgi:hypothetical protein
MIPKLLLPVGIGSNILITLAVLTGLRWIKVKRKVHQILALFGFLLAMLHAILGIYLTYFK